MFNFNKTQQAAYPISIFDSIKSLAERGRPLDLAAEVHQDLQRRNRDQFPEVEGSMLISARALATNAFTGAGAFVQTEHGTIAPILLPTSAAIRAGAQVIEGLTGNLSIPAQGTDTTMSWLHELDAATATDPAFGALNLSPKRCSGVTSITAQLDAQTGGLAARFLMASLARGLGSAVDSAALSGAGSAGVPLGIFNTPLVNTVTFSGAAATLAKCLDFQTQVATANASDDAIRWIAHPAIRAKWRALQKWSGASVALWDNDRDAVNGRQALVSTHASATTGVVCGDFQHLIIGIWGDAIQLIVNPYTSALQGQISFVANVLADVGTVRPTAFTRAADSAVI